MQLMSELAGRPNRRRPKALHGLFARPEVEAFCSVFEQSFSRRKNAKLLEKLRGDFLMRRWAPVLHGVSSVMGKAQRPLLDPVPRAEELEETPRNVWEIP